MTTAIFYFGLIFTLASIRTSDAVEIKKITVPPMYVLNSDKPRPLILDCEYNLSTNETGLVVKWLLNEISFYQWIPFQKPHALGAMKKHIDTTYSPSTNNYDQYRAVYIVNPTWNMTGLYKCSLQTFQGISERSAEMKIINPEKNFRLQTAVDEEGDDLAVTCSVDDIYPPPTMAILINGAQLSVEVTAEKDHKGPFDVTAIAKKPLREIESPATVTCILTISGTEYEKRKETVYNAPVDVESIDNELIDENSDVLSRMESNSDHNGNNSKQSANPLITLTAVLIGAIIFCS